MTLINPLGALALDETVQTTNTKLDSLIAKDYATETKQDDIITAIGDITVDIDTTLLAKESKQLPNNHDVTVSNQITGFATAIKQLPDNHNVTVSNIADTPIIAGFATAEKQLGDNHQVTVSNIENTPLIEGFSTDETVQKLVVTQFVGNKSMVFTEDETNEYYTTTGTTNTTGIDTQTITINKTTDAVTTEWS